MNREIATRMRQIRESYGKSQKDMAKYFGLGEITWQNYERGQSEPKCDTLKMLRRDGFNLNWVMNGHGAMKDEIASEPYGISEEGRKFSSPKGRSAVKEKIFNMVVDEICGSPTKLSTQQIATAAYRIAEDAMLLAADEAGAIRVAQYLLEREIGDIGKCKDEEEGAKE